jgi:hypothetical protein
VGPRAGLDAVEKRKIPKLENCLLPSSVEHVILTSPIQKLKKIQIYETTILPVLYGCETWCLTLKGQHRWRVLENRVMRILSPTMEEATEGWRKLHNEEFPNLYSSPNIITVVKWRKIRKAKGGYCMTDEKSLNILVGRPVGQGSHSRRCRR